MTQKADLSEDLVRCETLVSDITNEMKAILDPAPLINKSPTDGVPET
jgi:hypothetical protein